MTRRTRIARVVFIGVMAVVAGCGVPVEQSSRSAGQLPEGLELNLPTTSIVSTTIPATTVPSTVVALILYFVSGEGLATRVRVFDSEIDAATAISELAKLPQDDASAGDLTTGLGGGGVIDGVSVQGRNAVVELGDVFASLAGDEQILVLGQITLTLTTNRLAKSVVFTQQGEQVAVPDGNGEPQTRPLTRDDYRQLLSR